MHGNIGTYDLVAVLLRCVLALESVGIKGRGTMKCVRCATWIGLPILGFLLAAALLWSVLAHGKPALPALEPWGDLQRPFGDSLDAAVHRALGARAPQLAREMAPITLADYWYLDHTSRGIRLRYADGLLRQAASVKKATGVDSLGLCLEALHAAPGFIPAYVAAVHTLLARGATHRAHALVVQAVRLDPENDVLWALLGQAYLQTGEGPKARLACEHALRLGAATNRTLAGFVEMLVLLRLRDGDVAQADSLMAATAVPKPPWLEHYVRAQEARRLGDTAAVREALRRAASTSGAPAIVFVELGTVEKSCGDLDAAEQAFRRALDRAPHEAAANTGLGLVQLARGDPRGAVARFEQRIGVNPQDLTANFNLGRALLALAATESSVVDAESAHARADRCFTTCIESHYQEPSARLGRAQCRWARHDTDGAVADARAVLDSPTHAAQARLVLARVALTRGNPQEVVTQLAPLDAAGKLDAVGLAMLGKAQLELDQPRQAALILERAHALAPQELSIAINYGVALSGSGQLEQAETLLRDLAQQHPQNPDVLQNWAVVLQRLGRAGEADAALERAESLRRR